jgi:hypothetical protein
MDQKVKQYRFFKHLWLLHTPKKLIQSHLLRPGAGYGFGLRRLDPDPTKEVRIRPDPDSQQFLYVKKLDLLLVNRFSEVCETGKYLLYEMKLFEYQQNKTNLDEILPSETNLDEMLQNETKLDET